MSSKVHSQGNIPFSWENKPGVSKAATIHPPRPSDNINSSPPQSYNRFAPPSKLPPPPCPSENGGVSYCHDLHIPLPPCAFQPPSRSSSRKGLKKTDDPFLIAYKEVTKSTRKGKSNLGGNKGDEGGIGFGLIKNMSIFSCKQISCGVAEDSVIKLSQLPLSRSSRDGDYN